MSRNRDRLGVGPSGPPSAEAPPQAHTQSEAPFSFVVPTEFVELPSQGRFYPPEHPLHAHDTIEIKQMTAKEEDILTSRALLKKGVALDRVIASLIVDKNIQPESLLVGDRNAIMIAARISGYGHEYNTNIDCPSCNATQPYSFDLFDSKLTHGVPSSELGVRDIGGGRFATMLPRTKCEVVFQLLNGAQEKGLLNQIESARKRNQQENTITRTLRLVTVAVNGDESPAAINYFVDNVPSIDAQHLRTAYSLATPNVDLTQFFSCTECGFETELEVPLTSDFFWPKR